MFKPVIIFKTPCIKNILRDILNDFPKFKKYYRKYQKVCANIALPENVDVDTEFFEQSFYVFDKYQLTIVWDIQKILNTTFGEDNYWRITVKELLKIIDFNNPFVQETLLETKENFPFHSSDYIIIIMLSVWSNPIIIDGNHRLFEKFKAGNLDYTFKCLVLKDEQCLPFLFPESQKLVTCLLEIKRLQI